MVSEIDFNLILKKWELISDFVINAIDNEYYVKIFVNKSKILYTLVILQ